MPTITTIGSFRFFFSSSDGVEPPHVHVELERRVAKFWLDPVELASTGRIVEHQIRKIQKLVTEHRLEFLKAWHDYFGN